MSINRADVLKYLADVRSHYTAYHNHKETSAWAAVVVYLVLVTQIVTSLNSEASFGVRIIAIHLIVVLAVAVWAHIFAQFLRRRDAANYIAACLALGVEYLAMDENTIEADSFRLMPSSDVGHHSPHVLPRVILERAAALATIGHGTRTRLEWSAWVILGTVTIAAIARLWFHG